MTVEEVILKTFHTAPLLFVGSGLTRRYCGTPDWKGLLKRLAHVVQPDREPDFAYGTLLFEARNQLSEDDREAEESECLPLVAEMIKDRFDAMFYKDPRSVGMSSDEVEGVEQGASAFLSYLSRIFSAVKKRTDLPPDLQEEISDLTVAAKHSVDGVITTNYDGFIEGIFKDFDIYVGQDDLLTKQPTGYMEIYKIHGCHTRPSSLVFTKKSYERHRRNGPYLYAKLLTFFVEHPVLFLGYSMSDPDIGDMFASLTQCLTKEQLQGFLGKMLFVEYDAGAQEPVISNAVVRMSSNKPVRMPSIRCNSFLPIFKALIKVKHQYDVRLLRRIRKDLYATVRTNDPTDCVKVLSSDILEDEGPAGTVIGIATDRAPIYKTLKSEHIYRHVVLENEGIDIPSFVRDKLPELIQGANCEYPLFYYARKAIERGIPLPACMVAYAQKYREYDSILGRDIKKEKEKGKYVHFTLTDLVGMPGIKVLYQKILQLDRSELENGKLGGYLNSLFKAEPACLSPSAKYTTFLKRLVRVYDYLENGSAVLHHLENGTERCFTQHPAVTGAVEKARGQSSTDPHGTPSEDMLP